MTNEYSKDLLGNAAAVGLGLFLIAKAKNVNAKTSTKTGVKVTVSKDFRFGGSKVAANKAAFA